MSLLQLTHELPAQETLSRHDVSRSSNALHKLIIYDSNFIKRILLIMQKTRRRRVPWEVPGITQIKLKYLSFRCDLSRVNEQQFYFAQL